MHLRYEIGKLYTTQWKAWMSRSFNRLFILLGVDGATWDLIEPLLSEGRMPNFSKLMNCGVYGRLRSLPSMFSPRVWTSIATGVRPEVHGIIDFDATNSDVRVPTIWDVVEANGGTIGVLGMIPTWPPRQVRGVIVPGWMARGPQTYPEDLAYIKELEFEQKSGNSRLSDYVRHGWRALRHGTRLSTLLQAALLIMHRNILRASSTELSWRENMMKLRLESDLVMYLLAHYAMDLLVVLFDAIDGLSHKYWKYMDPRGFEDVSSEEVHRWGSVIPNSYAEVDSILGRMLAHLKGEPTIIIVSDHGFGPKLFGGLDGDKTLDAASPRVSTILNTLGLSQFFNGFSVGTWSFLTAKPPVESSLPFVDRAIEAIQQIRLKDSGQVVFRVKRHDPFTIHIAPNVYPKETDTIILHEKPFKAKMIFRFSVSGSGTHMPEGVILASGSGLKRGFELKGATVLDVAPTIFYLMGLPIAKYMSGRVLTEAIDPEYLREHPIETVDSYSIVKKASDLEAGERELVEERLRALGYIE